MKIVDNLFVKVRKLWTAMFGRNGDGSEIKLIKANPTTSESDPYLSGVEVNGQKYRVLADPETVQTFVLEYLTENPDAFEEAIAPLIAPEYDETTVYKIGNLLTYLGKQYYCIADAPAGTLPTNTTYFEEKSVADIIEMIKTGEITVGKANLANNFDSKMVLTDNSGYLYRTTGGALEVGEQNRVKKIIGASVPIINPLKNGNFANTDNWSYYSYVTTYSVANNVITATSGGEGVSLRQDLSESIPSGSKILVSFRAKSSSTNSVSLLLRAGSNTVWNKGYTISSSFTTFTELISVPDNATKIEFIKSGADISIDFSKVFVVQLTRTFGTTVANRLYTLEQAQAGTGIAKAKEILVKDYYPYNVSAFTHTKTSGKVNNGFNQFDLSAFLTGIGDPINAVANNKISGKYLWKNECGYEGRVQIYKNGITRSGSGFVYVLFHYTDGTQTDYSASYTLNNNTTVTSAFGKIVDYIFTVYTDTGTHNFTNAKMGISLYWDGERDGEYEPYQEWNYPVEDIELKGILSLDAQDNWVADGDEYLPSGMVNAYMSPVTLANLDWHTYSSGEGKTFYASLPSTIGNKACCCAKYAYTGESEGSMSDKTIKCRIANNYIFIRDDSCANTAALVAALDGIIAYVYLATPTESSADSYTELQNDSNWGTEKWIDTRDVPLPVFSTCEYIPDLKAKLETAPESPEEDGDYIMHRENGLNSYGSLSTWLSANGYNKLQDLLTAFGANGMVGGALRQQLAQAKSLDFLNTGCVDLGTLTWTLNQNGVFSATLVGGKPSLETDEDSMFLSTKYKTVTSGTGAAHTGEDKVIFKGVSSAGYCYIDIRDTAYADATAFANAMKGVLLAYELAD